MSLATSGGIGGGAGGGMSMATMAHGGPSALSTHQQASNAGGPSGPPPGTSAPPPNMASMAADLIDKNQSLNWKSIKNLAKMPIVSCDIYGDSGEVAYFPPVSNMDEEDEVTEEVSVEDTVDEVTVSEPDTVKSTCEEDPETEEAEVETEEEVTETLIAEQKEEKNEEEFDWF